MVYRCRSFKLFGGLFLSVIIAALFTTGCASSSSSGSHKLKAAKESHTVREPEAIIYADEAMLKKPYAIIGGTVENISGTKFEDVSVELELQRRSDGSKERRLVKTSPQNIAPGERGSYSLKVISDEWGDARIVSLRSQTRSDEIGFRTSPGARRPPERLTPVTRTVQVPRTKKQSGEEFINTPDNPVAVP